MAKKAIGKVIDQNAINSNPLAADDDVQRVNELAVSIKKRDALIQEEQEKLDVEKGEIKDISTRLFFGDVTKDGVPDIFPNHEYHTEEGILTVNFKIQSRPLPNIDGHPASEVLRKKFQEHFENLFKEDHTYELNADQDELRKQAATNADMFTFGLKDLTDAQFIQLITEHPDWVEVRVKNIEEYAKQFPGHTVKNTSVKVSAGFLGKLQKVEGALKEKMKGFIEAFIRPALTAAVKTGNKSKAS